MSYESTHNLYDIRRAFLIGTIDGKLFDVSTHLKENARVAAEVIYARAAKNHGLK